jgi:hypothetical protein
MHLRSGTLAVIACVVTALAALPAFADRYDAPAISVVKTSRASVTLSVRAGGSGTPAGFVVQYVKSADLVSAGTWDNAQLQGKLKSAEFVGELTYNTSDVAPTFRLLPLSSHDAELGDLFDETGVIVTDQTFELDAGTTYQFRVIALGDAGGDASAPSTGVIGATQASIRNCTYTQGYWKNHSSQWPVASLKLGSVTYTKAQLLSILGTPAQGNGLLILAHQLIAAKLNIAQGADPTPVSSYVADADAMIGSLVVPTIGSGYLDPADVDTDAQALDSYNNGNTYVPHCGTTPSQRSTWGALKTLYR